ncbi:NUDIX domain-containing protein [Chelativorans sp. AA-79]|uniref:NUDIX hydrolase n=1 Tax=Chelativorans sp. AA-79 TaxID=3028735 RepID=UPI0023F8A3D8|nr:NUDIX domain-containing protein [Chelativorans sp. AA-79]WEX07658.1 NUDIX domain-containing protein [Chelativorans sp. AA-79]
MNGSDIHAVSVAALSGGRFLLVRRGRAPSKGLFAFPGGRVEPEEDGEAAARRELHEETGLCAGEIALFREIVIDGEGGRRYRLEVFRASEVEGTMEAGDDADHAGWYTLEEMRGLPVTPSTLAVAEAMLAACEPL